MISYDGEYTTIQDKSNIRQGFCWLVTKVKYAILEGMESKKTFFKKNRITVTIGGVLILVLLYTVFSGLGGRKERKELREEVEGLREQLVLQQESLTEAESLIESLEFQIEEYEDEEQDLRRDLQRAEDKYEEIEDSIGDALGTVEILTKKSQVDSELLQKYSKVFFLNEHYVPETLEEIPEKYTFGKEILIHGKIDSFVEDMFEDAEDDGIELRAVSGFRSYDRQAALKSQYLVTYGSGANQFSADQGYSEHQLGTALDFSTEELGNSFEAFGTTEAYEWMLDNAYKYGFVLSYPEGNAYYQYEPWHWRFVGKDLARDLDRKDAYFYDLEQREIDEYTASFFDR